MAGIRVRGIWAACLLLGIFWNAQAQTITTGKDSTVVQPAAPADTSSVGIFAGLKNWDKPSRAALYSTIIPGGGQFYNKRYWKLPIIYAGGATIGYFIVHWHKLYLSYRSSYEIRTDGNPETHDKYEIRYPDPNGAAVLARGRDTYRRYRDLNIVFAVLFYGLQISEAYVDAHLKGFDVSDELSLQVEPAILPVHPSFSYAPGISIRLNLKKL